MMNTNHVAASNTGLGESMEEQAPKVKQVDFYKNPTILSRLVLSEKYPSALKRLKKHPEEASTWVCSKRNPFKGKDIQARYRRRSLGKSASSRRLNSKLGDPKLLDYTIRQLPIHVACNSLFRVSREQKSDLEQLITHLAVTYPEGCQQPDHEGKLPLHEAIWHNASPETISVLLMASPSTLHERDKFGRAPLELNRFRSGHDDKEQIKDMLLRGVAYWESAREESLTRKREDAMKGDSGILRSISKRLETKQESSFDLVEPVTWQKLSQRAIYLEQLLAGMYEKNYELGELVEELTNEKMELREELDRLQAASTTKDSEQTVVELNEEVDYLCREITRLQEELQEKEKCNSSETQFDIDAVRYLEHQNATLQGELGEMTERNRENELKLDRLEIVIASLRRKVKAQEGKMPDYPSSQSPWDDFMEILEALTSQSPLAMERFLSGKVKNLEEQLVDMARTAELDHSTSTEENKRLIRENEALQGRVVSLSSRQLRPSARDGVRRQTKGSRLAKLPESNPYETDSLDEILQQAAEMYTTDVRDLKEPAIARKEPGRTRSESKVDGTRRLPALPEEPLSSPSLAFEATFPLEHFESHGSKPKANAKAKATNGKSLKPTAPSHVDSAWDSELVKQLDSKHVSIAEPDSGGPTPDTGATVVPPYDEHRLSLDMLQTQLSQVSENYPPRSVSTGSGIPSVSSISFSSATRSLRLTPDSHRASLGSRGDITPLRRIPTEVIVALRTASFSTTDGGSIDAMLERADSVRGEPIPNDVKSLIRERYRLEGGDISNLILSWLTENLEESEGSDLCVEDLDTIFAGADQLAPSSDTELPPTPTFDSGDNDSPAAAFHETARAVSTRQLMSSTSLPATAAEFHASLVTDNLDEIIQEAARAYSTPILDTGQGGAAHANEFSVDLPQAFDRSARTQNTPNTKREPGDDLFRGYKFA